MRHLVKFYETKPVWNPQSASWSEEWVYSFSRYCEITPIYREGLKTYLEGAALLRDRQEFRTRYDERIDQTLRCEYRGRMYEVSIGGDTTGDLKETRFLGEAVVDGGM